MPMLEKIENLSNQTTQGEKICRQRGVPFQFPVSAAPLMTVIKLD
jgi:hypothetical protein